MSEMKYECKKCGKEHGMVIENMITGERETIDLCRDCIFKDRKPTPIQDAVWDENIDYSKPFIVREG